jgi:hypothetical protein
MKKYLMLFALALAFAFGEKSRSDQTCVIFDGSKITGRDLEMATKALKIHLGDAITDKWACQYLQKAALNKEILSDLGQPITKKEIYQEHDRIARKTRDPDKFRAIQDHFKGNFEKYLELFLTPYFVEQKLYHQVFASHPQIHREVHHKAEIFLSRLKSQKMISTETATDSKKKLIHLSPTHGLFEKRANSKDDQKVQGDLEAAREWLKEVVPRLTKDGVFPLIVDQPHEFLVVKKRQVLEDGTLVFDAYSFEKESFDRWHEREKNRILAQKESQE